MLFAWEIVYVENYKKIYSYYLQYFLVKVRSLVII